jgi:site-specific recombinase XerC
VTLDRPDLSRKLVLAPRPRRLPDVLGVEEMARLLEAAPGIKYRAALRVAYGEGRRMTEVAHLEADDIDSKGMLIRVEEGKCQRRPRVATPLSTNCGRSPLTSNGERCRANSLETGRNGRPVCTVDGYRDHPAAY